MHQAKLILVLCVLGLVVACEQDLEYKTVAEHLAGQTVVDADGCAYQIIRINNTSTYLKAKLSKTESMMTCPLKR